MFNTSHGERLSSARLPITKHSAIVSFYHFLNYIRRAFGIHLFLASVFTVGIIKCECLRLNSPGSSCTARCVCEALHGCARCLVGSGLEESELSSDIVGTHQDPGMVFINLLVVHWTTPDDDFDPFRCLLCSLYNCCSSIHFLS